MSGCERLFYFGQNARVGGLTIVTGAMTQSDTTIARVIDGRAIVHPWGEGPRARDRRTAGPSPAPCRVSPAFATRRRTVSRHCDRTGPSPCRQSPWRLEWLVWP